MFVATSLQMTLVATVDSLAKKVLNKQVLHHKDTGVLEGWTWKLFD
jgi:hypothetical protein